MYVSYTCMLFISHMTVALPLKSIRDTPQVKPDVVLNKPNEAKSDPPIVYLLRSLTQPAPHLTSSSVEARDGTVSPNDSTLETDERGTHPVSPNDSTVEIDERALEVEYESYSVEGLPSLDADEPKVIYVPVKYEVTQAPPIAQVLVNSSVHIHQDAEGRLSGSSALDSRVKLTGVDQTAVDQLAEEVERSKGRSAAENSGTVCSNCNNEFVPYSSDNMLRSDDVEYVAIEI